MAQLAIEMTADEAKAFRAFARLQAQQQKLEAGLKKTGQAGSEGGEKIHAGMSKATGSLISMTAAMGSAGVAGAIAFGTKSMQEFQKAAEAAGERVRAMQDDVRALFQLSAGPVLKQTASELRAKFGMGEQEAARLTFTAASAGDKFLSQDNLHAFAMARDLGINPEAMIAGQQKIEAAFGTDMSAGEFISKSLAAAGPSNVRTDDLAKALSTATVSFAAAGGTQEELFAMGSVFSNLFKSPEAASEKINSLTRQLQKNIGDLESKSAPDVGPVYDPRGLELISILPDLERAGAITRGEGKDRKAIGVEELLGDSTAVEGYRAAIGQISLIQARTQEVLNAGNLFGQRLGILDRDPSLKAARAADIATERRELAEEGDFATAGNLARAVKEDIMQQHATRGTGALRRTIDTVNMGVSELVLGPEAFAVGMMGDVQDPALRHQIGAFANRRPAADGGLGGLMGGLVPSAEVGVAEEFAGRGPRPVVVKEGADKNWEMAVKLFEQAAQKMLTAAQRLDGGATGVPPNEDL
jgi:hypothetical protein